MKEFFYQYINEITMYKIVQEINTTSDKNELNIQQILNLKKMNCFINAYKKTKRCGELRRKT